MNANTIFEAFGCVRSDYLRQADALMQTPAPPVSKRKWVKPTLAAACLLLLLAALPLGWMIALYPNTPDTPVIPPPAGEKLSITTIPGAEVINHENFVVFDNGKANFPLLYDDYIKVLQNSCVAIGEATPVSLINIQENDFVWVIATFDLTVTDAVNNMKDVQTTRVIHAARYSEGALTSFCGISDIIANIMEKPNGLFVLMNAESVIPAGNDPLSDTFTINGDSYNLADYADYYIGNVFDCDGEKITYFGQDIDLDLLREP